jgi:hypothetical protein
LLNPPAKELTALSQKHFSFIEDIVKLQPKIDFKDIQLTSLGKNLYKLKITVRNNGYLPTQSAMGKTTRNLNPLQIELAADSIKFLHGNSREQFSVLAGHSETTKEWIILSTKKQKLTIKLHAPHLGSQTVIKEIK